MACPTCDHTMQLLTPGVFWCPRCGTIKTGDWPQAPKLVDEVKKLLAGKPTDDIEEFVYLPEQRSDFGKS